MTGSFKKEKELARTNCYWPCELEIFNIKINNDTKRL